MNQPQISLSFSCLCGEQKHRVDVAFSLNVEKTKLEDALPDHDVLNHLEELCV